MRWDAVIRDADGRWADGGTGVTTLVDLRSDAQTFGQFNEHFQTFGYRRAPPDLLALEREGGRVAAARR